MRVLWNSCNKTLKNIRKNIRSGAPFYKNYTTDIFLEVITKEKMFKKTLCITASLKVCIPEISASTKTSSNVFWERSEIAWELAWKTSIMRLFIKVVRLLSRTYTPLKNTSYISRGVFENLGKFSILRIVTGKKHAKIRKIWIWTFVSLVHQINSIQEVLKLKQIFQKKNKLVTSKIPLFVICQFCSHHSICLNIDLTCS